MGVGTLLFKYGAQMLPDNLLRSRGTQETTCAKSGRHDEVDQMEQPQ